MGVAARQAHRRRRSTPLLTGVFLAFTLLVLWSFGCAQQETSSDDVPSTPRPQVIVLFERNRMIWLDETDDDQMEHAEGIWRAAWRAVPSPSVEVARSEFDTIGRTGATAGSYYTEPVDVPAAGGCVGLIVVIEPGDASLVERGDLVAMHEGARYDVVGRVDPEELADVQTRTYERMGLQ